MNLISEFKNVKDDNAFLIVYFFQCGHIKFYMHQLQVNKRNESADASRILAST